MSNPKHAAGAMPFAPMGEPPATGDKVGTDKNLKAVPAREEGEKSQSSSPTPPVVPFIS